MSAGREVDVGYVRKAQTIDNRGAYAAPRGAWVSWDVACMDAVDIAKHDMVARHGTIHCPGPGQAQCTYAQQYHTGDTTRDAAFNRATVACRGGLYVGVSVCDCTPGECGHLAERLLRAGQQLELPIGEHSPCKPQNKDAHTVVQVQAPCRVGA
jgi:hypothetical protein